MKWWIFLVIGLFLVLFGLVWFGLGVISSKSTASNPPLEIYYLETSRYSEGELNPVLNQRDFEQLAASVRKAIEFGVLPFKASVPSPGEIALYSHLKRIPLEERYLDRDWEYFQDYFCCAYPDWVRVQEASLDPVLP